MKLLGRGKIIILALAAAALVGGLPAPSGWAGQVTISDQGSHYRVVIDLSDGSSLAQAGPDYADQILETVPDFEYLVDSYLDEISFHDFIYQVFINRARQIKASLSQEYRDLIEGMASRMSGGQTNVRGDGRVSEDEAYVVNLITDVARATQCSALSVFGSRSVSGRTITSRNLEWETGSQNQLPRLQAATTILEGSKSVFMRGHLGYFGVLSAINDDKVFAAVLDSNSLMWYTSAGKRSYVFDLLEALRTCSSLDQTAAYVADPAKEYAFNHLVFLSDPDLSKVLENNISGAGSNMRRALRTCHSELNPGVSWGIDNSVCAVNSFVLQGNHDNHTIYDGNYARWNNYRDLLQAAGEPVGAEELKAMASYLSGTDPGADAGDIYRGGEQQMMIVEPDSLGLEVFFRPRTGGLPLRPSFERVDVSF
ncbi:MAG: hypothetical protein JRJ59_12285 [Deltaproteobacteria bacterium]|nr:hypothetical protein [Deltaproteobacteria bacterium]